MTKIKDKVCWVTGASSGIGEALVYELARQGARLIISARRGEVLERVKEKAGLPERNIAILPLDLAQVDQMPDKAAEALRLFGRVDILFNNGGISQRGMALDTPLSVDRKIMEVDYFSTIALTKAIAPSMVDLKEGHIVVTSSLVGKFGTPWRSSYAAAKHALHGFFDSLRSELHDSNVKVTMVCPGFIKTDVSVNALGADGKPTGTMDQAQAKGMTAEECARQMVRAVEKNKLEVVIGGKERFGVLVKRLFPSLFAKIILKQNVR
jgi:dehydrogenase/reductase SDR family member 7B